MLEYEIYKQNHYKQINRDISNKVVSNQACLMDLDTYKNIEFQKYEMKYQQLNMGII